MNYRIAHASDLQVLAKFRWEFKIEDGEVPATSREIFEAAFIEQLKAESSQWTHWVAEDSSNIVGMVSICRAPKLLSLDMKGDAIGYLTNTYVIPSARNVGIGHKLLKTAVVWAKTQNFELLFVWPSERSRKFYARSEFKAENEIMELIL